jgi:hypothetical protein
MGKSSIRLTLTREDQRIRYNSGTYLKSDNFSTSDNDLTLIQEETPPNIRHDFIFNSGDQMYMV